MDNRGMGLLELMLAAVAIAFVLGLIMRTV